MSKKILTLDNVPVINKKIGKVDTIEKLKASTIYSIGDVVEVLGYYEKGDGAGHSRQKKPVGYNGADAVIGADGSIWGIVHSGEIKIEWIGAKNNDDISDLLNAIYTNNSIETIVFTTPYVYKISKDVNVRNLYANSKSSESYIEIISDCSIYADEVNCKIDTVNIRDWVTPKTKYSLVFRSSGQTLKNSIIQGANRGQNNHEKLDKHGIFHTSKTAQLQNTLKISDNRIISAVVELNSTDDYLINNECWGNGKDYAIKLLNASHILRANQIVGGFDGGVEVGSSSNSTSLINIVGNYFDGSYTNVYTGIGIKVNSVSASSQFNDNYFFQQDVACIVADNLIGCTATDNVSWNSNSRDTSYALFHVENHSGCNFSGNSFINDRNPIKTGVPRTQPLRAFYVNNLISNYATESIVSNNNSSPFTNFANSKIENCKGDINSADIDNAIYPLKKTVKGNEIVFTTVTQQDINTLINTGKYRSGNGFTNAPYSGGCMLEVINLETNNKYGVQKAFFEYHKTVAFRTFENGNFGDWIKLTPTTNLQQLDTPYHASNMQKLGILDSYHQYITELHEYEKQQNVPEGVVNLSIKQPPVIPMEVEEYAKEYNLI